MTRKTRATVEDLYPIPDRGKAEIRSENDYGREAEAAAPGSTMPVDELFD